MKWEITRRFLLALFLTLLISVFVFLGLSVISMINWGKKPANSSNLFNMPGTYTLEFGEYISWKDNQVIIKEKGIKELEKYQLWIQVLNENGDEIYSRFKPQGVPMHYSPGRLIYYHSNSGKLMNSTLCVGLIELENQELSYIIGFPGNRISEISFVYNPQTINTDILKIILKATIISLIIGFFIAYIFSTDLINSITKIIDGIKELAQGDYSNKESKNKLFQKVFTNLNELASSLKLNKLERKKTEQIREEWIANITHDIKTPLSSIRGYAEVLLDPEYNLSQEERIKYSGVIMNKANYITDLIEDLKLTYQLKHDLIPLEKEEENLVEIVRDSIISIINNQEDQKINIHLDPEQEVFPLKCNARLLQCSIINIIYNAIIHNPVGTRIDVRIYQRDGVKIEIEDQGRGIKDEDLNKLFERYYRGTNTAERHHGSGLGLAIAKQIIQFHDGTIEVKSKIGVGTRVITCF